MLLSLKLADLKPFEIILSYPLFCIVYRLEFKHLLKLFTKNQGHQLIYRFDPLLPQISSLNKQLNLDSLSTKLFWHFSKEYLQ
jgi:hypothetical protein